MAKMLVGVMEDFHRMALREMDIPAVGDKDVLVKIHQCNICTTDWQTWAGLRKSQGRAFPWAPGHEMAGDVVEVGQSVRPDIKAGMRVGFSTQGTRGCGACVYCRNAHPSRCMNKPRELSFEGVAGSFGMSQYMVYAAERVYRLDDRLPYEQGGYLEPVATAVHGARRLRVRPGDRVLVIGAGNLGLVNAQVARVYGADVLVSEINPDRLVLAQKLGFATVNPELPDFDRFIRESTNGQGISAAILAVGHTKANEQAARVLSPMARILFFAAGYPAPAMNFDPNSIHYKEYELIGTFGSDPSDYEIAARLLNNGQVKVEALISQKVPLAQIQKAFEFAAVPGTFRVSLTMW
ncbi:MAG: alcohol dehydrogenase catalytic domain-containing protein [Negativicutes bacterium]|nr:alcohol dehydrogenase catalytic domain-containing protein [Negativicutes bacterium]